MLKTGNIKALAHITGGGLLENIPRALRGDLKVVLDAKKWMIPKVYPWLAASGTILVLINVMTMLEMLFFLLLPVGIV